MKLANFFLDTRACSLQYLSGHWWLVEQPVRFSNRLWRRLFLELDRLAERLIKKDGHRRRPHRFHASPAPLPGHWIRYCTQSLFNRHILYNHTMLRTKLKNINNEDEGACIELTNIDNLHIWNNFCTQTTHAHNKLHTRTTWERATKVICHSFIFPYSRSFFPALIGKW